MGVFWGWRREWNGPCALRFASSIWCTPTCCRLLFPKKGKRVVGLLFCVAAAACVPCSAPHQECSSFPPPPQFFEFTTVWPRKIFPRVAVRCERQRPRENQARLGALCRHGVGGRPGVRWCGPRGPWGVGLWAPPKEGGTRSGAREQTKITRWILPRPDSPFLHSVVCVPSPRERERRGCPA